MTQNFSSPQLRAGRALLGWTRARLAELSGVSEPTLHRIETGVVQPHEKSIQRILHAFDLHGVEFTANQGVRVKPSGIEVYEGAERFDFFYDFLYEQVKTHGGDICVSVTDERLLAKYRKDPTIHFKRMQDLKDRGVIKSFRVLANKSNFSFQYPYNLYKWQPEAGLAPTAFYTFGNCLALISFVHENPPYVVVMKSEPLTKSYQQAFDAAWAAAKKLPQRK